MNVCGYYGDYKLIPGKITVESWMADILINHGYGLSLKPGDESYERRNKKYNKRLEQAIKKIFRKEAN
ncbi:hypothetical protein [Acidiplasma cupricumulans]|uniref:hypothetical protein n=1 Tax=Acidiplasma cupricumulans TaxID=312540 RepID=UPI0007834C9D|nr:hypothetical protein [Acidiplasma cupricumulans]